jgi:ABC-type nitrate/sulfonate/bicarbonate transport system substrate-binding protein
MSAKQFLAALFAAFVGLLAIASDAGAAEKIRVSFAAFSSNYMPYHLAIEKGYFREEGIEIEQVDAAGGVATPALIAGDIAFSTSGSAALSPAMRGAPLKVLLVLFDRPGYQLWSGKPNISTLADLKGQTIGIQSRGDTFEIASRVAFRKAGIDPNAIGFTPLGIGADTRMAAIKTGQLGAVIVSMDDVHAMEAAGVLGNSRLILDFYEAVRIPFTASATTDALIRDKPQLVKGYTRAVVKGMRYMRTLREETIALMLDLRARKNAGFVTRERAEKEHDLTVASLTQDGIVSDEVASLDAASRADTMNIAADKIPTVNKLYDFSFARAIAQELDASGWKPKP